MAENTLLASLNKEGKSTISIDRPKNIIFRAVFLEKYRSDYIINRPNTFFELICQNAIMCQPKSIKLVSLKAKFICNENFQLLLKTHPNIRQRGIRIVKTLIQTDSQTHIKIHNCSSVGFLIVPLSNIAICRIVHNTTVI
jgi:hypothetical protein